MLTFSFRPLLCKCMCSVLTHGREVLFSYMHVYPYFREIHQRFNHQQEARKIECSFECAKNRKLHVKTYFDLKLYCRYEYTKPYMINRIWGLKQLWLQVNGLAWFHLQRLRWPVRNGEGSKNSKWKIIYASSGIRTHTPSVHDRKVSALDRSATRAWWWSVVKCLTG